MTESSTPLTVAQKAVRLTAASAAGTLVAFLTVVVLDNLPMLTWDVKNYILLFFFFLSIALNITIVRSFATRREVLRFSVWSVFMEMLLFYVVIRYLYGNMF